MANDAERALHHETEEHKRAIELAPEAWVEKAIEDENFERVTCEKTKKLLTNAVACKLCWKSIG